MPPRIAALPRFRGLPVPWNVVIGRNGDPLFTVNDDEKRRRAIRQQLCPMCGERLGKWKWFAGGPLSAYHQHGAYYDLPGHHECIQFALQICPYLVARHYKREIHVDPQNVPPEYSMLYDPTHIPDRPDIFVAVASAVMLEEPGNVALMSAVRPERPYLAQEFWRRGEKLSEEQALPWLRAALGEEWRLPKLAG